MNDAKPGKMNMWHKPCLSSHERSLMHIPLPWELTALVI